MKPYIMNYEGRMAINKSPFQYDRFKQISFLAPNVPAISVEEQGTTRITEALESTDPDQSLSDSTRITRSLEPGDPDSLSLSTIITKSIENVDPDSIALEITIKTNSLEPADPDGLGIYG